MKTLFFTLKRILFKRLIAPVKYWRRGGYDAESYWRDRLRHYGESFVGVGNEGLSEEENRSRYALSKKQFLSSVQREGISWKRARVLEIGVGTGYYTQVTKELGCRRYTGLDIARVNFPRLSKRYPEYRFVKRDITAPLHVTDKYDVIIMIDVIEHIVNELLLHQALQNISRAMTKKSVCFLGPVTKIHGKKQFYFRLWSIDDIAEHLETLRIRRMSPFRDGHLLTIRPK